MIFNMENDVKKMTLVCPVCSNKIPVTVEPLQEEITCLQCKKRLRVVKKLLLMGRSINPSLPKKHVYSYELHVIED